MYAWRGTRFVRVCYPRCMHALFLHIFRCLQLVEPCMHVFRAVSMLRFSMFPAVHTLVLVRFRRLSVVYGACCFRTGHFPVGCFISTRRAYVLTSGLVRWLVRFAYHYSHNEDPGQDYGLWIPYIGARFLSREESRITLFACLRRFVKNIGCIISLGISDV